MSVAAEIERKLTAALQPVRVQVIDESELHKGHAGHRPGGQSHFRVEVVAAAFEGQSRVARQRRVYEILADELKAGVHALALKTLTPAEDAEKMIPPWQKYPEIPRFSIGWRMGNGESHYVRFYRWYKGLSEQEAEEFARKNPEFEEWEGFYAMIRHDVPPSEKVMQIGLRKLEALDERRKKRD